MKHGPLANPLKEDETTEHRTQITDRSLGDTRFSSVLCDLSSVFHQFFNGLLGPRWWALVISGVILGSCGNARAQTFYKWTDDRGIVHFADQAPTGAKQVEERHLPALPALLVKLPEDGNAATPGATPGAEARVILETHEESHTGPSTIHVTGKVKNVGASAAETVTVAVSAVDGVQGTPCLQVETSANPSTLGAGESGSFETDIDSPCLRGDTPVVLNPSWK